MYAQSEWFNQIKVCLLWVFLFCILSMFRLQCFETVGWAAGRSSSL